MEGLWKVLIGILIDEAFPEGKPHILKVQLEGPAIDIPWIKLHPLFEVSDLITSIPLPDACQSWFHGKSAAFPRIHSRLKNILVDKEYQVMY